MRALEPFLPHPRYGIAFVAVCPAEALPGPCPPDVLYVFLFPYSRYWFVPLRFLFVFQLSLHVLCHVLSGVSYGVSDVYGASAADV